MPRLSRTFAPLMIAGCILNCALAQPTSTPQASEALERRRTPDWFGAAKFGIFVHWGLYSVPAWAPPSPTPDKVTDWRAFYTSNPYAEWYLNSLRIEGSPTSLHHRETYGPQFDYYQFSDSFNRLASQWDATAWAELFRASGARYAVLTAKHHDGFSLYPSQVEHPLPGHPRIHATTDLVGRFTEAMRGAGLRVGVYYSGGLDWTFTREPITNLWPDLFEAMPATPEYKQYADSQVREIIRRYRPDILWNDVNYPKDGDLVGIFTELFSLNPEAVINDRWRRLEQLTDFETPEYTVKASISKRKWETCRGVGHSFSLNTQEGKAELLTEQALVHLLVDVVSKNGNLLLGVGPAADGTLPEAQVTLLRQIGKWLKVNGEAIFDTRPWTRAEDRCADGTEVRYTRTESALYICLLQRPPGSTLSLPGVAAETGATLQLLGRAEPLSIQPSKTHLTVSLPPLDPAQPAYVLKLSPCPVD
ncbi:alpha-L-fucosidase [Nibricoccus sp. IMCC34717]|uniref:alpha-L-fucosidase n=1 Tax=Nibricoccus sp. IMCC34717 TaxID=3034021 RepID=UPI00384AD214